MTTTINGSTGIDKVAAGAVTTSKLPAGTVLQVVYGSYTGGEVNSSSSTFADTGLTATITPSSATSKILVFASVNGLFKQSGNTSVDTRLVRNSTALINLDIGSGYNGSTTQQQVGGAGISYLDSPATTSATTYKVQFASDANTSMAYCFVGMTGGRGAGSITLMEIAA